MTNKTIQGDDNNKILSLMLAQEVKKARSKKYPSAEDILKELNL